jgi:magnesium-transporting ATPase (P-type)
MKVEIILLFVIGLVFLIDFLMRGIKKKPSSTEVDVKKTYYQSFNNTNNKPKKKINLLKLFVVFIFGIPISLIGSYLVALYYKYSLYHKTDTQFLQNFRLDSDFIIIIQTHNFTNCLIFFSIYLVLIATFSFYNKTIWNNVGVLKYISKRKKNISLVLIIIPFLKVILHYLLYPITNKQFLGIDPNVRRRNYGGVRTYGNPYKVSFGEHLDSIFEYELFLFIPSIIVVLFIAWYFNDKIKAR